MTPTRRMTLAGLGYEHGMTGADAPAFSDPDETEVYQLGRGKGLAVSGRMQPRAGLFESDFCRAELARPIHAPRCVVDIAGGGAAGEPSPSDEAP